MYKAAGQPPSESAPRSAEQDGRIVRALAAQVEAGHDCLALANTLESLPGETRETVVHALCSAAGAREGLEYVRSRSAEQERADVVAYLENDCDLENYGRNAPFNIREGRHIGAAQRARAKDGG